MRFPAAALAFVFAATLSATGLAFVAEGLNRPVAVVAMIVGLVAGIAAWLSTRPTPTQKLTIWDWLVLTAFGLASLRAFLWVVFAAGNYVFVQSANNIGDMSLHLGIIRYLGGGAPFWPESLILTGVPLTYPIGADLLNALLEVLGMDTLRGLVIVGLVGALLTGWALWRWGGAFGIAALIFNGGLAGFAILSTHQFGDYQKDLIWKNLFLAMFVTQRGLLIALPAGLLLLSAWRDKFLRRKGSWLPRWLEVVLYAGMPIFNFHAFIFLSMVLVAIFAIRKDARRSLLELVGVSFVPATAIVCLITGFFSVSSGAQWQPDWMLNNQGLGGLLWDFGLTLPLLLILAVVLLPLPAFKFLNEDQRVEARCFVWPAFFVFVVASLFALAPWAWDNMKLILWAWLVMAPYVWSCLLVRLDRISRAAICTVLFFSGAVSLIGGLGPSKYEIAKRSELAAWQAASADIPWNERFAIEPTYNHPLLLLGRKVVCGYEGHLWSHGLHFQGPLFLLQRALKGETSWRTAAVPLKADWLAVRNEDPINETFAGNPPHGSTGILYDLKPLKPSPDSRSTPPQRPRPVGLF